MDKKNKFMEDVIKPIKKNTMKPYILISLSEEKTTIYSSKVGGQPYLPEGFEYPCVLEGEDKGRPLQLMAQINFEEIPHIEDFPVEGILQFYFYNDELGGLNFENKLNQNKYRVIYHEKVIKDISQEKFEVEASYHEYSIFQGNVDLLMTFTLSEMPINTGILEFEEMFLELYNQTFDHKISNYYDIEDSLGEILDNELNMDMETSKHIMGGYPSYIQSDPREYHKEYKKYDTLLFQLDSDGFEDCEIIWGDCGTGSFLIKKEDLKNKDFTSVLYSWDCY